MKPAFFQRTPTIALMILTIAAAVGLAGCPDHEPASTKAIEPVKSPEKTEVPATTKGNKPTSRKRLHVSAAARRLLSETMLTHGDNMESMLWSALMLDHESVATISEWMSEPPLLKRPDPSTDKTTASALPPLFFDFQDRLQTAAKKLQKTAVARDDAALGSDIAAVVETCVGCHALFGGPGRRE